MDFVTYLPRTSREHDAVWVIVVGMTFTLEEFCRFYIREIIRLHRVPVSILSEQDPRFKTHFWKSFQRVMRT